MASGVKDRHRRRRERATHASCSQFTGYTSKQEPVETLRCQRAYREKWRSLVFMLGIRGTTTKSHSMGSRHPCETEIKGGAGGGKSGAGRKAGTLTKFPGPERVKCPQLPCTQVQSPPPCTTVRHRQRAPEATARAFSAGTYHRPKGDHNAATFISFVFFVIGLMNSFVRWGKSKKHTNLLAALRDVGGLMQNTMK